MQSDKEHWIGRKFPPKGTLDRGAFNFIFRACVLCNREKGNAERHVSSVTLFNSPARGVDAAADETARHKASQDFHPDGKALLVQDAFRRERFEWTHLPGLRMAVSVVAPPQLDPDAVSLLAGYQVQALFAMVTTPDPHASMRVLHPDEIRPFGYFLHRDWGNPQLLEVIRRTALWPLRANVDSAGGYFKAILRRSENDDEGWFWAFEWNKSVRVAGAIVHPGVEPSIFESLPDAGTVPLPDGSGLCRLEVPLDAKDDILFESPP